VFLEEKHLTHSLQPRDEDASLSYGATLRNYFVIPILVGTGFTLGMCLGAEIFGACQRAIKSWGGESANLASAGQ
jgi:hypothetical protein